MSLAIGEDGFRVVRRPKRYHKALFRMALHVACEIHPDSPEFRQHAEAFMPVELSLGQEPDTPYTSVSRAGWCLRTLQTAGLSDRVITLKNPRLAGLFNDNVDGDGLAARCRGCQGELTRSFG